MIGKYQNCCRFVLFRFSHDRVYSQFYLYFPFYSTIFCGFVHFLPNMALLVKIFLHNCQIFFDWCVNMLSWLSMSCCEAKSEGTYRQRLYLSLLNLSVVSNFIWKENLVLDYLLFIMFFFLISCVIQANGFGNDPQKSLKKSTKLNSKGVKAIKRLGSE